MNGVKGTKKSLRKKYGIKFGYMDLTSYFYSVKYTQ